MVGARRILIAGGGIGGLTAAATLLQAGFEVAVFEQAPVLSEVGAGIQVSANAGRVYRSLGLMEAVEAAGVMPDAYHFRIFDSGEILQTIPLGAGYRERHGVPYVTIHRADLHRLLVGKVSSLDPGAVRTGRTVTSFAEDEDGVTVTLADGTTERGAVLIGADGIKSVVRRGVVGSTEAAYTGDAVWRVMVPMDRLPPDHRWHSTDIWAGPGRHAVTYALRGGTVMNLVGCVEYAQWEDESWTTPRPWAEMRADFDGWHPIITGIIDAADRDQCFRWALRDREPIRDWSTARVTLLGDAAHPTLPYMAQGAAMAVEDAAVLARALLRTSDVAAAIALYQANRVDRTARIVNESRANRALFHLPDVAALRAAFAKRDMNAERSAWLFSYDPTTVELVAA
ncbi:FAD-dependent monooxygenase [Aquibium carbonis]|nr:FAD-dependent monooxygenase [Aquibium carbonis]